MNNREIAEQEIIQKSREVEKLAMEKYLPISLVAEVIIEDNGLSYDERLKFLDLLGRLSMNIRYARAVDLSGALWYAETCQSGSDLRLAHLMNYLHLPDDEFPRELPPSTIKAIWKFFVRCMERADEKYLV